MEVPFKKEVPTHGAPPWRRGLQSLGPRLFEMGVSRRADRFPISRVMLPRTPVGPMSEWPTIRPECAHQTTTEQNQSAFYLAGPAERVQGLLSGERSTITS